MTDVTDVKYKAELSPGQVIEQFEYRIQIHETYAGLVLEDPDKWAAFGDYEFHIWAINGYEWAIHYIKDYIYKSGWKERQIMKTEKLKSRKFWVAVGTVLVTLFLGLGYELDPELIALLTVSESGLYILIEGIIDAVSKKTDV